MSDSAYEFINVFPTLTKKYTANLVDYLITRQKLYSDCLIEFLPAVAVVYNVIVLVHIYFIVYYKKEVSIIYDKNI